MWEFRSEALQVGGTHGLLGDGEGASYQELLDLWSTVTLRPSQFPEFEPFNLAESGAWRNSSLYKFLLFLLDSMHVSDSIRRDVEQKLMPAFAASVDEGEERIEEVRLREALAE